MGGPRTFWSWGSLKSGGIQIKVWSRGTSQWSITPRCYIATYKVLYFCNYVILKSCLMQALEHSYVANYIFYMKIVHSKTFGYNVTTVQKLNREKSINWVQNYSSFEFNFKFVLNSSIKPLHCSYIAISKYFIFIWKCR